MPKVEEGQDSARVRAAFQSLAFGAACHFVFPESREGDLTLPVVADNLEKYRDHIRTISREYMATQDELRALKRELAAVGSIIRTAVKLDRDMEALR